MWWTDHPRIRGEHRLTELRESPGGGSSPHTRGALRLLPQPAGRRRIIPAYAGSTAVVDFSITARGDHPRIRGEHLSWSTSSIGPGGSSPHTRGAPRGSLAAVGRPGIIPAYAGSTLTAQPMAPASRDHPRIRGEHPLAIEIAVAKTGSSPHTRGAPSPPFACGCARRIIPAYAGSTNDSSLPGLRKADHPRIRGEHHAPSAPSVLRLGSSPHTRGARRCRGTAIARERIIPAYAGSTNSRDMRRNSSHGSSPHTRGARRHRRQIPRS